MKEKRKILVVLRVYFIVLLMSLFFVNLGFVTAAELRVTNEHPFLINGNWVEASDLVVGDLMTTVDGKLARITEVRDVRLKSPVKVFNIEASVFHDFVVGDDGLVVHNKPMHNINPAKPKNLPEFGEKHLTENEELSGLIKEKYPDYNSNDPKQGIGFKAITKDSAKAVEDGIKDGKVVNTVVRRDGCKNVLEEISYFESELGEHFQSEGINVVEIGLFASRVETAGLTAKSQSDSYFRLLYELIQDYKAKYGDISNLKAVSATQWRHARAHRALINREAKRLFGNDAIVAVDKSPELGSIQTLGSKPVRKIEGGYVIDGFNYKGQEGHLQLGVNEYDVPSLETVLKKYLKICD